MHNLALENLYRTFCLDYAGTDVTFDKSPTIGSHARRWFVRLRRSTHTHDREMRKRGISIWHVFVFVRDASALFAAKRSAYIKK